MEENENNQLSKELEFERQKNKYVKKELEQKEKKLQITASILVIVSFILFAFLMNHYEYEMEEIYQLSLSLAVGGTVFYFSYKKYPKLSSIIFCIFFVLAAYRTGGFFKWSFATVFAMLFIFNLKKKEGNCNELKRRTKRWS